MESDSDSSSEPFHYLTTLGIQFMEEENGNIYDEFGSRIINVEVHLRAILRREVFDEEEEEDSRSIPLSLNEVMNMDGKPVLDLRQALTDLGASPTCHSKYIAFLLDHIQRAFVGEYEEWPLVVFYICEEYSDEIPIESYDEDESMSTASANQSELNDEEIVSEVWNLRGVVDDIFTVVNEPTEVDIDTSYEGMIPASEEAIALLKKVCNRSEADMHCPICLEDEQKGDFLRMPCSHLFHSECLVTWLRKSSSCPICRFELST